MTRQITIEPNRSIVGRKDKSRPWRAMMDAHVVAFGKSRKEAMDNAIAVLAENYAYRFAEPLIRPMSDGSVFVAQQIGDSTYTLVRWRKETGCSWEHGALKTPLVEYFEFACADYEDAIRPRGGEGEKS